MSKVKLYTAVLSVVAASFGGVAALSAGVPAAEPSAAVEIVPVPDGAVELLETEVFDCHIRVLDAERMVSDARSALIGVRDLQVAVLRWDGVSDADVVRVAELASRADEVYNRAVLIRDTSEAKHRTAQATLVGMLEARRLGSAQAPRR